jgi:hypothetical protein
MDVMIASEGAAISRQNWDAWVGTPFPVALSEINLISYSFQEGKRAARIDPESLSISHGGANCGVTNIPVAMLLSNEDVAVDFKFSIKNVLLKFSMLLISYDSVAKPVFFLRHNLPDQR